MDVYKFRLTLFVSFLLCANAFAQPKKAFDFNQSITVPGNSVRLDSLLKNISHQTGFIFSYNTRKINHALRFSFSSKSYSLEELLTKIKEKTGLDYSITDHHIILKSIRLQASPLKVPSAALAENKKDKSLHVINSKTAPVQQIDSSKKEIVKSISVNNNNSEQPLLKDEEIPKKVLSIKNENKDSVKPAELKNQTRNDQTVVDKAQSIKKDSLKKKNTTPSKPVANQKTKQYSAFQIKTGITADETLYLGPALQFGVRSIYAMVYYKTDFKIGLFSWGLGTSFKLSKNLNLDLQVTTGNVRKLYDSAYQVSYDSGTVNPGALHRGITTQSNLTKVMFLIEKKISPRFVLQGGVTYNLLTTRYSDPPLSDVGKTLCAIKPPYLINNSTNARGDSNVKSWIGVQVNLLYIINFSKRR